jgi:ornithine carbamoyltransferase
VSAPASPRHFLDVTDLSRAALDEVLVLAARPAASLGRPLADVGVALVFEKPSTRTRHSMEMAVVQLGGHPIFTRAEEVGFDDRETVEDITRIMCGYHGVLAARVFDHGVLARMATVASVPVVNMLSDRSHPLQALADVLTMRAELGPLAGRTVAWVGDWNNVARSLAEACALEGMAIRVGSPVGYGPTAAEVARIAALGAASVTAVETAVEAARGAVAVHTDVFVSMGQEAESSERLRRFADHRVTERVMAAADPAAIFMHCLPAHRGVEVDAAVIDGPRSRVVPQAHHRMHAARGLLAHLVGVRP